MDVKFSIIIPVYNAEKYLSECINSLIKGINDEIEIILINDGSNDNSLNICKTYQSSYKQINVIDIENGGVSNARNLGIKEAKGKYIFFVDADDFVSENFYESISEIVTHPADLYLVGYNLYEKNSINKSAINFADGYCEDKQVLYNSLFQVMEYQVWNKIFLRDVIVKNGIKFDSSLVTSEDLAFWIDYFNYISSIYCDSTALYNYRINESGAVRNPKLIHISNICDVFNRQIKLLNKLKASKIAYFNLSVKFIEHISLITNMCITAGLSKKEIKKIINESGCLRHCNINIKKISALFKYVCLKFNAYGLLHCYFKLKKG